MLGESDISALLSTLHPIMEYVLNDDNLTSI